MRAMHERGDVEVDHPFPFVRRSVDDRAQKHEAGVVDQRVEPPERRDGPLDRIARLSGVGDVGVHVKG